jgi:hypothetical protein
MISKQEIQDFFNQYASTMNNVLFAERYDVQTIMDSFAEYVVGANPVGIAGGKNNEQFSDSIRQGIDFYRKIGITSMNITAQEVTILDEFHASVKVYWSSLFFNENTSGEIPFEVVYIVQCKDQAKKIFAFITGDEMSAFKEYKLID